MLVGRAKETFVSQLREIIYLLEREPDSEQEIFIPVNIFSFSLSPLQSLVNYLKDTHNLSFKDIAEKLGRSYATIYAAYKPSLQELPQTKYLLPLALFSQDQSVLETCVVYLKEKMRLNFSEIGRLLNKDPRTIWSTYNRTKKKK